MKLRFKTADLSYSIETICSFLGEVEGDFFKEPLFMLYPQINKEKYDLLKSYKEKQIFLKPILTEIYHTKKNEMETKSQVYQEYWDKYKKAVQEGLEKVFMIFLGRLFNDMEARVGINPVSPRYLGENAFDIIHLYSPQGALLVSLHEIIHFVWFHVWNKHFKDDIKEYESPHLKWIFSEMVPDMIMKKAGLGYLNPENRATIYPYFKDVKIKVVNILNILNRLMQDNEIIDFMEKGYVVCLENEEKIRKEMH